jgi:hypothetical protein
VKVLAPALAAAIAIAAASAAVADPKPVKEDDVPKAVRDALLKKHPRCERKGWTTETEPLPVVWTANLECVGRDESGKDTLRPFVVRLSDAGKILEERETISLHALPADVKRAWETSKYAKGEVSKVERVIAGENEEEPTFHVVVAYDGRTYDVVLDKLGRFTREEARRPPPESRP